MLFLCQVPVTEQELKGKSKKKDTEKVEKDDRRRDETIDSQGEGKVSQFTDISFILYICTQTLWFFTISGRNERERKAKT